MTIAAFLPRPPQFAAPHRNARQLAGGRAANNNNDAAWTQQQNRETQRLLQQMRRGGGGDVHNDDFDIYGHLDQRERLLQELPPPSEADIATLMV